MRAIAVIFISLFLIASCNPSDTEKVVDEQNFEIAGRSKVIIVLDSVPLTSSAIDKRFLIELMTEKDTFSLKPKDSFIAFPVLNDSLKAARISFDDFQLKAQGMFLKYEYPNFYFPKNNSTTFTFDYYPFEKKHVKDMGGRIDSNKIYYRIDSPDERVLLGRADKIKN